MSGAAVITMPSQRRKQDVSPSGDAATTSRRHHRRSEFDQDLTAYLDEIGSDLEALEISCQILNGDEQFAF